MGKENEFYNLSSRFNKDKFRELHTTMSFPEYLDLVMEKPTLAFSAYQRLYRMIISEGITKSERYRKTVTRYKFFDDIEIPIFGLHESLESLVKHIRGAAFWHGPEKRIMLLHGPVGSSKSTICRRLKRGLEQFCKTEEGAVYTYDWINIGDLDIKNEAPCPLNDDPLKLIPVDMRSEFVAKLNNRFEEFEEDKQNLHQLRINGELNPYCKFFMQELLKKYEGDWGKVVTNHIRVRRILFSEADRIGIGTFQPKDPKNQDATELTGDINYMKLAHYGVDSDVRSFSQDGEFQIANRGLLEFIEVLKLEKEFLYDLLGVCQERQIKPKKFSQVDVDIVLISHTNLPEFEKLKQDQTMEAFRDRTVRIDVPYLLECSEEKKVLDHDYNPKKIRQHVAPHTIEIAALWAVLTRLNQGKNLDITLVEKAKLYDRRAMPGWTEDRVKELIEKESKSMEGLAKGISVRFVQNAISSALVSNHTSINPFMVLNEIKQKLKGLMISDKNEIEFYETCLDYAKKELDDILKNEVQKALVGDEQAIEKLFTNYLDNLIAHVDGTKLINPYTQRETDPDERLMVSIEEKADVPSHMADDFRRSIAEFMFTQSHRGKQVKWDSNPRLAKALQKKLFEDTKDTIKLAELSSAASVSDKALQEKIDAIKRRMIQNFGYNEESATDVLNYVSNLFAVGDLAKD